ncbi:MAG: GNAT family N-acetyltransferase [Allomuricauda sp.]
MKTTTGLSTFEDTIPSNQPFKPEQQMDHGQLQLTILDFNSEKDRDLYRAIISNDFHNPYYHFEYIQHHQSESNRLAAILLKENDQYIAVMPVILNAIPNTAYTDAISPYGYSGPLYKENLDKAYIDIFWAMVDQWYRENNVVTEFIRFSLNNNQLHYSGDCVQTLLNVCGHLKGSFPEQWESFGKKVRNNYRKAQSFDLTFKLFEGEGLDEIPVDQFYGIYHDTMVRNNASRFLYFSKDFFHKLVLSNKNDFTIGMVYHGDRPVSTELHIHYNNSVYAFLGGTDSEFFHLRPNDFLRVEVIKWAVENKKRKYILGGGIKNDDGLYKSKKAFFPKDDDCVFYTGRKVINKKVYDALVENAIKERDLSEDDTYFPLYRKP